ncbi:hypothetical protein [Mycobacterium hubeiense]|uniref:hypothetical protein n=1 Tax=Mycobacterium hubeiense TaxID=1867256 RepID=UPI001E392D87|nr:hypothetical protein [Mycobacterium sp. QGD 101]
MTATTSSPPADPEVAALDLIVQAAEAATGSTAFRPVLQDLADALHAEGSDPASASRPQQRGRHKMSGGSDTGHGEAETAADA